MNKKINKLLFKKIESTCLCPYEFVRECSLVVGDVAYSVVVGSVTSAAYALALRIGLAYSTKSSIKTGHAPVSIKQKRLISFHIFKRIYSK